LLVGICDKLYIMILTGSQDLAIQGCED